MKRYAEYKDSGIEWIGEIPSEWKSCKAKYIFQDGDDGIKIGPFGSSLKGKTLEDGPYKIYNQAHLIQNDFSLSRHFVSHETYSELSSYVINPGDILFSMMGTIGKCRIMPDGYIPGIMDSHLLKARLNHKILPRFFEYVFDKDNSNVVIEQLLYKSNGSIMNGLNSSIIKNINLPLPKIEIQQAIVNYLDCKTAGIDTLIADKQKLIDLLREKRQVTINEAVTKGLDKSAKMKDSGIDWIGNIPSMWKICKLKYFSNMKSGNSISSEDINQEGKFPVYGGNGLRGYTSSFTNNGKYILIGRQGALCGNVRLVEGQFWATEHAIVVYEYKCISKHWYRYLLDLMNLNQYSTSAAQPGLSVEQIINLFACFPSYDEQKSIAAYLDHKTTQIESLISDITEQIEKLKEYRQSIISELVTGKVAV